MEQQQLQGGAASNAAQSLKNLLRIAGASLMVSGIVYVWAYVAEFLLPVPSSTTADAAKSTTQTGIQRNDLDALGKRIAALESAVKALTDDVARRPSSADDRVARLLVVTEALGRGALSALPARCSWRWPRYSRSNS